MPNAMDEAIDILVFLVMLNDLSRHHFEWADD
jgi:hypothetical protein